MSSDEIPQNEWRRCQPGSIRGMLRTNLQRRKLGFAVRVVGLTAAVFLMSFLALARPNALSNDHEIGGIRCSEVHKCKQGYQEDSLKPDLKEKVEQHIVECVGCRTYLSTTTPNESSAIPACEKPSKVASVSLDERQQDMLAMSVP